MKFAEKYVPLTQITDDAYDCPFSDFPCLKASGLAVGEGEFKCVDLYFPIDDESKEYDLGCVDYNKAIAVYTDKEATFGETVEISDFDAAVEYYAYGYEAEYIITSYDMQQDNKYDTDLVTYCERRLDALCDGEFLAKHDEWTQKDVESASEFFSGMISYIDSLI